MSEHIPAERERHLSDVLSGKTEFVPGGTLPKPGPFGRLVRLLFGAGVMFSLAPSLIGGFSFFRESTSAPTSIVFWIVAGLGITSVHHVINLGLGKSWGHRPQMVVLAGTAVAILLDFIFYGAWWAPPLGLFTWSWLLLMFIPLGIAFLLAAVLATPGCEMRSFNQLISRLRGQDPAEHFCPGGVDFADRWEAKWRR
ncbi:MAG: hypothetical protein ACE5FD_00385 [Anaerolineae bacterium]